MIGARVAPQIRAGSRVGVLFGNAAFRGVVTSLLGDGWYAVSIDGFLSPAKCHAARVWAVCS